MTRLAQFFLSLTFFAVAISKQIFSNTTSLQSNIASYCGSCEAGGPENNGIFFTVPLTYSTYTLDCVTVYITGSGMYAQTTTITNEAVLSSFDHYISSIFPSPGGSRVLTVPVSIFPSYGIATADVNPLRYGTVSTMAGTTTCVSMTANPRGTVPPLQLYPEDTIAQAAATTSLLEAVYFSPLPTSCSIPFAGEPYHQIPILRQTRTSFFDFQAPTGVTLGIDFQTPTTIATPQQTTDASANSNANSALPQTTNEPQESQPTDNPPFVSALTSGQVANSALPAKITSSSSIIQINSESAYIISSHTLTPGGVVTIDSITVSLASDRSQIVINSVTETISQPASTTDIGGLIISAFNGPQSTSSSTTAGSGGGQVFTGGTNSSRLPDQHLVLLVLGILASIICI